MIENQAGIQTATEIKIKNTDYHPSEIIERLRAFINRSAKISKPQKKNLLRKFVRLKADMDKIAFANDFKIASVKSQGKRWSD